RGSDRKHIETAKFKKQTLEKEIDFLEKNLAVKKDEWTAYSDKVKSDLEVPAKRHMKNVEVPTGEKSMFGLGKEIRSEEHTSELQSRFDLVCRLLLEKKKTRRNVRNTRWRT